MQGYRLTITATSASSISNYPLYNFLTLLLAHIEHILCTFCNAHNFSATLTVLQCETSTLQESKVISMGRQWLILAFTVGRMLLAIGMVAHIMACIWFGLGQACDSASHGWSRDSMDRHTGFAENDCEDAQSLWPVLDTQ